MALAGALLLFATFALNVGMESYGARAFLDDVGEMLMLFAASILFVVAILKREAAAGTRKADRHQQSGGKDSAE